jgi:hypothetical protein
MLFLGLLGSILEIFDVRTRHVGFGLDHSGACLLVSVLGLEIHGRNVDLKWFVEVERLLVPISSRAEQGNSNCDESISNSTANEILPSLTFEPFTWATQL